MKTEITWKGDIYDCEWLEEFDLDKVDPIVGVHAFVFDEEGKLLIIKLSKNDHWTIPGGHPEKYDANLEETLRRELDEEADVDIKDLKLFGVVESCKRGTQESQYQVRYVAKLDKIRNQTIDIAENEILERKFIDPKDFLEYTKWLGDGQWQIDRAVRIFGGKE